jgi:hypothetical protein
MGSVSFNPVTASGPALAAAGGVLAGGVLAGDVATGTAGTVVDGVDGVVTGHGAATVMVWSWDAVKGGVLESLTVAVKVNVPALVAVPEITPDEDRAKPGGSGPDADQVKGLTPPSTVRLAV